MEMEMLELQLGMISLVGVPRTRPDLPTRRKTAKKEVAVLQARDTIVVVPTPQPAPLRLRRKSIRP
jgi:hypothetical protein